ncbi:BAG family molecular chaperone regulator 8, chloroplastic [Dendrobium catenatum]|nr:BAG family molecular chaperone regulator 8, chloroplastic [Dendrobium catenatum]
MTPHHHHYSHHHEKNLCHQTLSNHPYYCSSCCCSCNCNSSSSLPPPPLPISTDQFFQSMATNIFKTQSFQKPQQVLSQSLLQDLIHRVSSLESSLSQLSYQTPRTPSAPPSPSLRRRTSTPSLREVAARTIQARFRRFLVRRSQTLRDLKRLASIKSSASALRSSISGDADAELEAISQEAMDLLLQLDSIQSSDPMIRDGKRSISRDLARMLEFVDNVLARERRLSLREVETVEDAAPPPVLRARSAKRVSFADNGRGIEEEAKEGSGLSRFLEEKEEAFGNGNGAFHGQNRGIGLSAPQPLQMELRLGL